MYPGFCRNENILLTLSIRPGMIMKKIAIIRRKPRNNEIFFTNLHLAYPISRRIPVISGLTPFPFEPLHIVDND